MATAQARSSFEIAPFIGYRFGGLAYDTCAGHNQTIDSSRSEGFVIGITLANPEDSLELLYSRQRTSVEVTSIAGPRTYPVSMDHWMAGAVLGLSRERATRVHPFFAAYGGVTDFRADPGHAALSIMPAAALGAGLKINLPSHLAMRFDTRFYATFVTSGIVQFCSSDGCETVLQGRALHQGEVAAALVLKL